MTVTAVRKDMDNLTLTLDAEFDASPERVWQLWADPRQLERWWGPPGYPATFTAHDFRVGGRSVYFMTGPDGPVTMNPPDGPTAIGYWDILDLDPPHSMKIEDGFEDDGTPNDLPGPGGMNVTIVQIEGGRTRMTIESTYPDVATMEQLLAMGQEEGLTAAVGQIDAILAEDHVTASAG